MSQLPLSSWFLFSLYVLPSNNTHHSESTEARMLNQRSLKAVGIRVYSVSASQVYGWPSALGSEQITPLPVPLFPSLGIHNVTGPSDIGNSLERRPQQYLQGYSVDALVQPAHLFIGSITVVLSVDPSSASPGRVPCTQRMLIAHSQLLKVQDLPSTRT